MADRLKTFATWAIAALAGAISLGAIATTGSPIEARKEYRDRQRLSDFQAISGHVSCMAGDRSGPLPATLAAIPGCELPRLADPYTGQPYRYEVVDRQTIRLCAGFEARKPVDNPWSGGRLYQPDGMTGAQQGCRDYRIHRPAPDR